MSQTQTTQTTVTLPTKSIENDATVEERLTDNAVENILPARYLKKDEEGDIIETPAELFERVATNVAKGERIYTERGDDEDYKHWSNEFEHQMKTLKFIPNSPTLMNAGLELQQLSACFVLEPTDDMEDILETARDAGLVFKSGGGVGYTFSHLRPKGALVGSTKGKSSGPVSFMRLYDEVCNQVKQGGKRRGAQMGIMRIDHPDIGRFITAKREEGELSNFNISVGVTDEFVDAVQRRGLYELYDPKHDFDQRFDSITEAYEFYHPTEGEEGIWAYADDIVCTNGETLRERWEDAANWDDILSGEMQLPAAFLWDVMVDGAWRNGEPGLFYLDETNRQHSFGDLDGENSEYKIHATNPCAEQPLVNNEACNLGHVNLSLFKKSDTPTFQNFDGSIDDYFETAIETGEMARTVRSGVRFLDNVVDMSDFPLPEISEQVRSLRKIGLGVMGWAQLLYQCGIEYGSDESIIFGNRLMNFIDRVATQSSHQLAVERGSFPAWEDSKYADPTAHYEWFATHVHEDPEDYADGYAIRNHNVTTVAPTGTTSMIADTSGGIEPVYNVAYRKHVGSDIGDLVEFDSYFEDALAANDIDVDDVREEAADLMESGDYDGPHDLSIPDEIADVFVTTGDVTPEEHTLMQRTFQQGVDSGISKTINLPSDATRDDVAAAYTMALDQHEIGAAIKGMTVYRDQSREEQVMTTQKHSDKEVEKALEILEEFSGYEINKIEEQ